MWIIWFISANSERSWLRKWGKVRREKNFHLCHGPWMLGLNSISFLLLILRFCHLYTVNLFWFSVVGIWIFPPSSFLCVEIFCCKLWFISVHFGVDFYFDLTPTLFVVCIIWVLCVYWSSSLYCLALMYGAKDVFIKNLWIPLINYICV